ncbi:GNAT family N-acetyltransferase, partial [Streptomyces sp. NPDC048361]|uniref:GNAT family N-acetyltransferase n=1 Tax=Streptomyces sp. NPDC048361 TaxID=3154720 RepID=UPI00343FF4C1
LWQDAAMITSPIPPVVPAGHMAKMEQPVLALSSGLELRPWRVSDADALVAAAQEPAIRQWSRLFVTSQAEARERIERMHERWQNEQSAIWAIAQPDGGQAVGLIGWGDIDLQGGSAEILYWLLPAGRGRGAMVEATKRVSRWAFDDLGLPAPAVPRGGQLGIVPSSGEGRLLSRRHDAQRPAARRRMARRASARPGPRRHLIW